MFIVLLSSVSAVVATRTALSEQYYYQLAKTAAEAGLVKAQACLKSSAYQQPWPNKLVPGVTCNGNEDQSVCDIDNNYPCKYVLYDINQQLQTTFDAKAFNDKDEDSNFGDKPTSILSTGTTQLTRTNQEVWREYKYHIKADLDADGHTILRTY